MGLEKTGASSDTGEVLDKKDVLGSEGGLLPRKDCFLDSS